MARNPLLRGNAELGVLELADWFDGGATPEMLSDQPGRGGISVISEIYNDFDYALTPGSGMFSYGE